MTEEFQAIVGGQPEYSLWFVAGETSLTLKPDKVLSDNQRPFTCLNNVYKWFTSCLLDPIDTHLNQYDFMELEQRGAKKGCGGTIDNLLIDRMVLQDCPRRKRNKDVKIKSAVKLYSNVDPKMETVRRFEEHAVKSGNISLVKDAKRFAEEQGLALNPELSVCMENGTNVHHTKVGEFLKKIKVGRLKETVREEKWQEKLGNNGMMTTSESRIVLRG